jgi:enoyl-CoA hydratase/carnithine racemase
MALLFRTVGRRHGLELIYTSRRIGAAEAARIGLINRSVPRAELQQAAQSLAEEIASRSPAIVRLGRRAFQVQDGLPLDRALEYLADQIFLNSLAEDAAEGVAAFFEKRKPEWKGR